MAGSTIHHGMISFQGEPAKLMHHFGVADNPGFGIVASGAIGSQGIVMHIGVTGLAFGICLLKLKILVTASAIDRLMLAGELKTGGIVIERGFCKANFPVIGSMTNGAINFEPISMRRLSKTVQGEEDQYYFK
jgi:hypothetical protein